ncbi:MAG: GatB/YqeY domain-containing protein [Candidatus Saccharibacteria bacterium]
MALKEKINDDLKAALLSGNHFNVEVLRGLKAVILNEEVALGKRDEGLDDTVIEQLMVREVKKRNESAIIYDGAGRPELALNEKSEAKVISSYIPEQLSEEDINKVVIRTISELDVTDLSGMGNVIGNVKKELGNTADGSKIAKLVKDALIK